MITAVDSNILIDILRGDPLRGEAAKRALTESLGRGRVVACDVVYGEVAGLFPGVDQAARALRQLGVAYSPTSEAAAMEAARIFHEYCCHGGDRRRLVPDFLVGAHALGMADRLLTRDRGFYRTYFAALRVIDPCLPSREWVMARPPTRSRTGPATPLRDR